MASAMSIRVWRRDPATRRQSSVLPPESSTQADLDLRDEPASSGGEQGIARDRGERHQVVFGCRCGRLHVDDVRRLLGRAAQAGDVFVGCPLDGLDRVGVEGSLEQAQYVDFLELDD